jgi:RimJ/RimL family protein N-acetyltransferase
MWPVATTIETSRLTLEPLRIEHADEMVAVLDDQGLYEFTGGQPQPLEELRETYRRRAAGRSPDGARGWLNWIVRLRASGEAIGTVQATVRDAGESMAAEVAWTIDSRYQGTGFAKEAAEGMAGWLRRYRVDELSAHIRPDHAASIAVARHLGLRATDRVVAGEVTWMS